MFSRLLNLFVLIASLSACSQYKDIRVRMPDNANRIIEEVLDEPLPQVLIGEVDSAQNDGLHFWFERIGNPEDPAILLIMGYNTTGLAWDNEFCQLLVNEGFQVIRYDNRDIGKTSRVRDWTQWNAYNLSDMARDGIAILDHLGIDSAHVAGISMGGMIGQTMALNHPDRVISLISISTTGHMFDPELVSVSPELIAKAVDKGLRYGVVNKGVYKTVKGAADQVAYLQGKTEVDEEMLRSIARTTLVFISEDRIPDGLAARHQMVAMRKSGARYEALKSLEVPVLVFHGDIDPLIQVEHAQKYLKFLQDIHAVFVPDLGHIPERHHYDLLHDEFLCFLKDVCPAHLPEAQ